MADLGITGIIMIGIRDNCPDPPPPKKNRKYRNDLINAHFQINASHPCNKRPLYAVKIALDALFLINAPSLCISRLSQCQVSSGY